MTLFDECLIALENKALVLTKEETEKIFNHMIGNFSISLFGKIDWKKIERKKKILSINDIRKYINLKNKNVHILWDEASLPALKAKLDKILHVIDDVTAVSFDTWIYSPECGFVIEFYHEGEVTIGWI